MSLHFLDFDYSEDEEGTATWDAVANVPAERLSDLLLEITTLLAWAEAEFGQLRGPVESGGLWNYDLQCERHGHALQTVHYAPDARQLQPSPTALSGERVTLCLSLSGGPVFADAARARFSLP